MLGEHFLPPEKVQEDKVLQDNYYSFEYRKSMARHHMHFVDFKNAEAQLRSILEDELNYYGLKKDALKASNESNVAKDEKSKPIDLDQINIEALDSATESEEFIYSRNSHPIRKVLGTLLMLAEVLAFRLQSQEALRLFDYVEHGYFKLYGSYDTMPGSYVLQQKAECHLKRVTERDTSPVALAVEQAEKSIKVIEALIGKQEGGPEINNCLLALRIQTLGDAQRDGEQHAESE